MATQDRVRLHHSVISVIVANFTGAIAVLLVVYHQAMGL
jgi:hypothetical protein